MAALRHIVANTVKGKGVSFMENNPAFHGMAPNDEQLNIAMEELIMSSPSIHGASRDGYGNALLRLASNPDVVVLEADLGKSTKSCHFRTEYPDRTFSLGIAEQNMMLGCCRISIIRKNPICQYVCNIY